MNLSDEVVNEFAHLCGWSGDKFDVVEESMRVFGGNIPEMPLLAANTRTMLWDIAQKRLGHPRSLLRQEIGDCVSHGYKNGCEILQLIELKDGSKFRQIFTPWIYGTSRVQIGQGQLGNQDGSNGSWAAAAVAKYGILYVDVKGVPVYSGSIAKSWGRSGPPKEFFEEAAKHLVKIDIKSALVKNWSQLTSSLSNGYPVPVCSNQGFTMLANSRTGFHEASGQWSHCLCLTGFSEEDEGFDEPYATIENSWGDVHGVLIDKKTGLEMPRGMIRARKSVVERMLAEQDSFAVSNLELGFVERTLERPDFDM